MSATEPEVLQPELAPEPPAKKSRAIAKRNGAKSEVTGTLVEVADKDLVIEPRREGVDINTLMVHAVQTGNIDTMERVMAIRRELKAEAAREAFFAALSAFQAECPIIKRKKPVYDIDKQTRERRGIRYHYAPMDDIVRIVGPLLTKHGLSYKIETKVEVRDKIEWLQAECIIHHEFGHQEKSPPFEVPLAFSDFMSKQQSFGSASTFAKRYAFLDALGVMTGDDDNDAQTTRISPNDARAARQPVTQPRQTPTAQKAEAQKANGGSKPRPDLEPAGEGEAIDTNTIKGLTAAMEHAALSNEDFKKRFPKLAGLEQVKKSDTRVIMSWVADPSKN